jgi:hypothetical protein
MLAVMEAQLHHATALQMQADAILERMVTVVCDGWANNRHPRIVMEAGDPQRISHGICDACMAAMLGEADLLNARD